MEIKSNQKVSKIELWDEAHKRKNGEYKNAKTNIVMEKLEERKKDNNGSLSFSDYREIFKSVHGKEAKELRGYYGDKYWSEIKVSQGLTFLQHPDKEGNVQFALRALGDNVENMTDEVAMIRSFLKRKFPQEDLRNEYVTTGSDEVDLNERVVGSDLLNESHNQVEEHAPLSAMQELHPSYCARAKECHLGLSLPHEQVVAKKAHTKNFDREIQGSVESTLPDKHTTTQELDPSFSARTEEDYIGLPLSHMVAKKACIEKFDKANQGHAESTKEGYPNQGSAESTLPDKQITTQALHPSFSLRTKEDNTGSSLPHMKAHIEKIDRVKQRRAASTLPDKTNQELHPSNYARTKEGCTSLSSPHEDTVAKKAHESPKSKNGHAENSNATKQGNPEPSVQLHRVTKQDNMKVFLVSLNPRSKNNFVADGTLVSRDKTYVVGGNMLGDQYVEVSVCAVSRLGHEILVRPSGKLQTVRDAIGHVIAWPLSHVKKKNKINHSYTTSKQATKHWVVQDLEKDYIAGTRSNYRRISL